MNTMIKRLVPVLVLAGLAFATSACGMMGGGMGGGFGGGMGF